MEESKTDTPNVSGIGKYSTFWIARTMDIISQAFFHQNLEIYVL